MEKTTDQSATSEFNFSVGELLPLATDDVSRVGSAIAEAAYAAKEADGTTQLILQDHLTKLCKMQRKPLKPFEIPECDSCGKPLLSFQELGSPIEFTPSCTCDEKPVEDAKDQVRAISGGTNQTTKVLCPCGKELPSAISVAVHPIDANADLVRATVDLGNVALG